MTRLPLGFAVLTVAVLLGQTGCVVPQAPGKGRVMHRIEPETHSGYWLYLPEDYIINNGKRPDHQRWPLVVTFHGMRPYDDAHPQICEWQQEADRYGFITIAPDLRTCDSFMQYPLRDPDLSYVKEDERASLAIMDEVCRTTNADPNRVLATSFSCGGYLAHFMVNRHPERFTCLAVRQSNFAEELLNPMQVPKYRNMRVAIFFGENDFKPCRDESIQAVEWYRQYRFNVAAKYVTGLGHQRTPQTAAMFFANIIGATPKTPPDLGTLVLKDIPPEELGKYASQPREPRRPESGSTLSSANSRRSPTGNLTWEAPGSSSTGSTPAYVPPAEPVRRTPPTLRTPSAMTETPKRRTVQPY